MIIMRSALRTRRGAHCDAVLLFTVVLAILFPSLVVGDELLMGGMTWMTQYPATWNAGAPKVVSDGLHDYAVLCGFSSSQTLCSVVRKRGLEGWTQGGATWISVQPPVAVIDRKGRLNIFYNDPQLHHIRFDHPSVDILHWVEIPTRFSGPVAYLHAGYDASIDTIMLAFNETTTWTVYFAVKYTDVNDWIISTLPSADPNTLYLYARTLHAGGRYFVLVGEHPRGSPNANYTAAILFESASPFGPWGTRVIHRVTGENAG
ncbi:MAG: hypothetical protein ACRELS_03115, partial [Candidatus Rokuibacteriota bacterium]